MKKYHLFFIVWFIGIYSPLLAQQPKPVADTSFTKTKKTFPQGIAITAGFNHIFCDKSNVDEWTYHTSGEVAQQMHLGGAVNLTGMADNVDFGIQAQSNSPFNMLGGFGGVGIINTSQFRTFLNVDVGAFISNISNVVPPHYMAPANQQGQNLYLHYQTAYAGLSLKNMFVSKPNSQGLSLVTECNFQFGYVSPNQWQYGYYGHHDRSTGQHFQGTIVSGMPALSNVYASITLTLGFLVNTSQKTSAKQRYEVF